MSLVEAVKKRVIQEPDVSSQLDRDEALRDAARLADLYADVRPAPFIVPIERFVGLPILGESKLLK